MSMKHLWNGLDAKKNILVFHGKVYDPGHIWGIANDALIAPVFLTFAATDMVQQDDNFSYMVDLAATPRHVPALSTRQRLYLYETYFARLAPKELNLAPAESARARELLLNQPTWSPEVGEFLLDDITHLLFQLVATNNLVTRFYASEEFKTFDERRRGIAAQKKEAGMARMKAAEAHLKHGHRRPVVRFS